MTDVLAEVRRIISQQLSVPMDQVQAETRLEDIGFGSLDALEIVFALEETFNIELPFNANTSSSPKTVAEVAEAVQAVLANSALS